MLLTHHIFVTVIVHNFVHNFFVHITRELCLTSYIQYTIKLPIRNDKTYYILVLKNTFILKSLTKLFLTIPCISTNKNSTFIILDLVYMIKENNMILNEHCHCSTLYTKYVLNKIHITI
jgi:hypothetical protein